MGGLLLIFNLANFTHHFCNIYLKFSLLCSSSQFLKFCFRLKGFRSYFSD